MSNNADQYIFPFGAAQQELLAQINLLRDVETDLTPARQDRVVELLERLVLLGNDLTEHDGRVQVRAQVIALAARIKTRSSYSDRSVREWCRWAVELGVLTIAVRSHVYGRREWNQYTIEVKKIRDLVTFGMAGSGRKWPEVTAAPRPEVTAAPRPEVTAAPSNSSVNRRNNSNGFRPPDTAVPVVVVSSGNIFSMQEYDQRERTSPAVPIDRRERTSPGGPTDAIARQPAGANFPRRELEAAIASCGVARAREALHRAIDAGLSSDAIQSRIARFRSLPECDQIAGKLYNWLTLPRSYDLAQLGEAASSLALAPGLSPDDQRLRAELIRYGRDKGWSPATLQTAVARFEREHSPATTAHT